MAPLLVELEQLEVEPLEIIINASTHTHKQSTDLATISGVENTVDITEISAEAISPDIVAWVACCCCCCCD
jgi:hypothetical protein